MDYLQFQANPINYDGLSYVGMCLCKLQNLVCLLLETRLPTFVIFKKFILHVYNNIYGILSKGELLLLNILGLISLFRSLN